MIITRIGSYALAGAALIALSTPAADARGGYSGSSGYHGAPTSTHYGTTNNGTHYAYGPNGAAAAHNGSAAAFNANTGHAASYNANTGQVHNSYTNQHVDNNWNGSDYAYHPYGYSPAAVATAAAVTTAAVIGARMYALPPACSPYGAGYYYCGGAYYQPQYQGTTVVYVVVGRP